MRLAVGRLRIGGGRFGDVFDARLAIGQPFDVVDGAGDAVDAMGLILEGELFERHLILHVEQLLHIARGHAGDEALDLFERKVQALEALDHGEVIEVALGVGGVFAGGIRAGQEALLDVVAHGAQGQAAAAGEIFDAELLGLVCMHTGIIHQYCIITSKIMHYRILF